jgi:hypothetical protein
MNDTGLPPQTTFLNNDVLSVLVEHVKPKYRQQLRLVSRQFNGVIKAQARKHPRHVVIRRTAVGKEGSLNYVLASLLPVKRKKQWIAAIDLRETRSDAFLDARLATNLQSVCTLKIHHQPFVSDPLLVQLTNLTKLRVSYCSNVTAVSLSLLTGLTSLSVRGNKTIDDETLENLTSLRHLDVSECFNMHGEFLGATPNMESLTASNTNFDDRRITSSLSALTKLDVSNNLIFTGQTLHLLTRLRSLRAYSCPELRGDAIASLTTLEQLNVSGCRNLDYPTLMSLTRLTKLEAQWCPNFNNATFRSLTLLTELNVRGTASVSDELFINTCFPQLVYLDVAHCPLVTDQCVPFISHVKDVKARDSGMSEDVISRLELGEFYVEFIEEAEAAAEAEKAAKDKK